MSVAAHELHVEHLIGRRVSDPNGASVGRIAEIAAKRDGDEFVVSHYLVGPRAWIHRFAVHGLGLRLRGIAWVYRVEWDRMDLSDPDRPAIACPREALKLEYLPPRKRGLKRRPSHRLG
ncbi:MAG TPA: hypothetical protein VGL62_02405 [Vicinamibacterales bacterium]|jgi:hypothetical protein